MAVASQVSICVNIFVCDAWKLKIFGFGKNREFKWFNFGKGKIMMCILNIPLLLLIISFLWLEGPKDELINLEYNQQIHQY